MRMLGITTAALLLAVAGGNSHAALVITPTSPSPAGTTDVTSNLGSCDAIKNAFGLDLNSCDLELVYKADFDDGGEGGTFADFYSTVFGQFDEVDKDPSGATITWTGDDDDDPIKCPECYLLVKGGNAGGGDAPKQYIFDIASWNGTDTIDISDFWAGGVPNAISNVAIWSNSEGPDTGGGAGDPDLPVPTPIALIGVGAFALGWATRKARRAVGMQN
jgi:hypothetical protein